jgi:hypothetical protein
LCKEDKTTRNGYNCKNMTPRAIGAAFLLVVAAAAQKSDDNPTVELNGGMTAQLLTLGRDSSGVRPVVTAAVKITNTGKNYVLLMIYGAPSAIDDGGVKFDGDISGGVSGIAWCQTRPAERCIGIPEATSAFALQNYTEIDPERSVTIHFKMQTPSLTSKGKRVSVSAEIAYRLVSDLTKDDVSDAQKLKQVRKGNLSFEPVSVTDL